MCRDCTHWIMRDVFNHYGTRFAPCALKPDKMVKDSRVPGAKDLQAYAMSETYTCGRFQRRLDQLLSK